MKIGELEQREKGEASLGEKRVYESLGEKRVYESLGGKRVYES